MTKQFFMTAVCGILLWACGDGAPVARAASADGAPTPPSETDTQTLLAPLVADDTCVVGYVKLASLRSLVDSDALLHLDTDRADDAPTRLAIGAVRSALAALTTDGAQALYIVAGLKDAYIGGGPLVFVDVEPTGDAKAVVAMLQGLVQTIAASKQVNFSLADIVVRQRDSRTILVGTALTVDRYDKLVPAKRDDLTERVSHLVGDGADLASVFSPGADFRRVIRELWPALPEPMTPLKGDLADKWLRLEALAKLPPHASGRIVLEATDAASAQAFVDLLRALPDCDRFESDAAHRSTLRRYLQMISRTLLARVEENRAVIDTPTTPAEWNDLTEAISDARDSALAKAHITERMNHFKLLGLAALNYSDSNKHLPPPAIRDKEGKAQLSWRVAILPFLDQAELFNEFHLDEPWDSPHNRELVKRMPEVYADPDPKIRAAAGDGKTTFVAPVGPDTVFDTKDGVTFREITDGTSNTAMIVETTPERAVEWTKPADWDVDMANPLAGVARSDQQQFAAAYCDGSVRLLPVDIKPEVWKAILTRSGGESVDGQ
jgi:hypothetical protein